MLKFSTLAFLILSVQFCLGQIIDSSIAVRDNSIYAESNNSNGIGTNLFAGRNGQGNARRALIKFSQLIIQPDSVKGITIRLQVNQVSDNTLRKFRLYKLTADWGEGTSSSAGGAGAAATTNDATWNFRFFNSQSWSTSGGDYVASPSDSVMIDNPGVYTFSGSGLLTDYKSWVTNPATNFGWILIGDETANNSAKRFTSREGAAAAAPKIFVNYNTGVTPVTLTNFTAKEAEGKVRLTWQTSSEINSHSFRLQHSKDGTSFNDVKIVPGAGTSNLTRNYQAEHVASKGKNYYRLLMIDLSGRQQYSHLVTITIKEATLTIYPNPTQDVIYFNNPVSQQTKFSITNTEGRQILKGNADSNGIDIQSLTPGQYFLYLEADGTKTMLQFLKR
jgi:hypothetical protein